MKVFENFSKNVSLRTKILCIVAFVSILSMCCLLATLLNSQNSILREALLDEVSIVASDISGSLAAALLFDDQILIDSMMQSFAGKEQVLYIEIDVENREPLKYVHQAEADTPYAITDRVLQRQGHRFGEVLEIQLPLQHKSEVLGSLYIQADLRQIRKTLLGYAMSGLLGLVGSALLGLILALKLQKIVTKPVEQLALTMSSVSLDQDFSRRMTNDRGDEMGMLIDNFNQMLNQLEVRDQELSSQRAYLDHLAYHDFLTGLPNRLLFRDRLASALVRSRRTQKKTGLFFLDLDRFKNINDTLGHDVGDRVLKLVTQRLQERIREEDTLARLGGDEFVLIVEEVLDPNALLLVAEKIQQAMTQAFNIEGRNLFISASIGVTCYPDDAETVEDLMKCADAAMYRSKADGRSTFNFYKTGMAAEASEALLLESNMHSALLEDEFELHFQPQIDLMTETVHGMEAMLYWRHPTLGLLAPEKFLPIAEESDLILAIGRWVMEAACLWAKSWQLSGAPPCKIAVNISPRQFYQIDLCLMVAEVLQTTGLDAKLLELEITETIIMADMEKAIETMQRLIDLGVRLAIDDFGTGYSSLSCLERFPISCLKIERSFLAKIQPGQVSGALVEAIIALGKTMRLDVIAEGVETEYQKSFLKRRGCRIGQGCYLSIPLPAPDCGYYLKREAIVSEYYADASGRLNDLQLMELGTDIKTPADFLGMPIF